MKIYACRFNVGTKQNISIVFANTMEELFWNLDEVSNPYDYEIIKLNPKTSGVFNFVFKKYDDNNFYEMYEEPLDSTDLLCNLPDMFENQEIYVFNHSYRLVKK